MREDVTTAAGRRACVRARFCRLQVNLATYTVWCIEPATRRAYVPELVLQGQRAERISGWQLLG
jgi:hypothetical protein